jgi:hypothetical protein
MRAARFGFSRSRVSAPLRCDVTTACSSRFGPQSGSGARRHRIDVNRNDSVLLPAGSAGSLDIGGADVFSRLYQQTSAQDRARARAERKSRWRMPTITKWRFVRRRYEENGEFLIKATHRTHRKRIIVIFYNIPLIFRPFGHR